MTYSEFLIYFYILWAANLTLTLFLIGYEIKLRNPAFCFWLASLAAFVIPSYGDPFLSRAQADIGLPVLDLVNNPLLLKAQAFALLFGAIYACARLGAYRYEHRLDRRVVFEWPTFLHRDAFAQGFSLIAALLCAGGVLSALIAVYFGSNHNLDTVFNYSNFMSDTAAAPRVAAYYLGMAFSPAMAVAWWCGRRSYALVILSAMVALFYFTNSRQFLFPLAMAFVLYFIFKAQQWYRVVGLAAISLVAYVGLHVLVALRSDRTSAEMWDVVRQGQVMAAVSAYDRIHTADGIVELRLLDYYFMQDDVRARMGVTGDTYLRALMLPIPSNWSHGLKPIDPDVTFYQEYFGNYIEGDLTILIYGNSYENFGWPGLFLGIFWAFVALELKRVTLGLPLAGFIVLSGAIAAAWVHIFRGGVYNAIALITGSILATHTVCTLVRMRNARGALVASETLPLPVKQQSSS